MFTGIEEILRSGYSFLAAMENESSDVLFLNFVFNVLSVANSNNLSCKIIDEF